MSLASLRPLFEFRHPFGAELRRLWVFPGQGTQRVGMGHDLYQASATYRRVFDEAADVLRDAEGVDLRKTVFEGPATELGRTPMTQPAVLVSSIALLEHLRVEEGIEPALRDLFMGHSAGEWTAHVAAGALALPLGARAVYWRGRLMEEAFPFDPDASSPMAAVFGLAPEEIRRVTTETSRDGSIVVVANLNAPTQTVISGHPDAVQRASGLLTQAGARRVVSLPVAAPFHSPLMAPVQERLVAKLRELGIEFAPPSRTILYNVRGLEAGAGERALDLLIEQITGTVRWAPSLRRAWELGAIEMVDVDVAGEILTGLGRLNFSREMPVQLVNPRVAMQRHALRTPPGVIQTTVYPPSPDVALARLLGFSYDEAEIARAIRELVRRRGASDIAMAVLVMDNRHRRARDAGMRELMAIRRSRPVARARRERSLKWPGPIIRDLPTQPLSPDVDGTLRGEIYGRLRNAGLAPLYEDDLVYYVASRWAGEPGRLQAILDRLGRILDIFEHPQAKRRAAFSRSMGGLEGWELVVMATDTHKFKQGVAAAEEAISASPGVMKKEDLP